MNYFEQLKVNLFEENLAELFRQIEGAFGFEVFNGCKIESFIKKIDEKYKDPEDIALFLKFIEDKLNEYSSFPGIIKAILSVKGRIIEKIRDKLELVYLCKKEANRTKEDSGKTENGKIKYFSEKLDCLVRESLLKPEDRDVINYRIYSFISDIKDGFKDSKDISSFIEHIDNLPTITHSGNDRLRYDLLMKVRLRLIDFIKSKGEVKEESPYDEYDESDKRIFGIPRETFVEMLAKAIESIKFDKWWDNIYFSNAITYIKEQVSLGKNIYKIVEYLGKENNLKSSRISLEIFQEIMRQYKERFYQKHGDIPPTGFAPFISRESIIQEIIVDSVYDMVDLHDDVDESENEKSKMSQGQMREMNKDVMRISPIPLTAASLSSMNRIKETGNEFYEFLECMPYSRELEIAKQKLEECVLWAVKGVTK